MFLKTGMMRTTAMITSALMTLMMRYFHGFRWSSSQNVLAVVYQFDQLIMLKQFFVPVPS